ncbi:uncharacterized protein LOC114519607 [Dendronephthya gigantea]|uniref:uncharacterized protein LOC114519607 n=1 Tax=Dendronephthya gigantea TaxID=151771 RepID=UPI00106CCD7B|nr:uncharacterized protein LOC114519607 [Dendronephthya gigantea]
MARLSTKTEASNSTQNPESKSSQQSPNEGTTDGLENRDESTTMQSLRSVTPSQTRVSNTEEQVAPTPSQATATTKGPFRTTKGNDGIFVVSRPTSDRDRDYVIGLCTGVLIVLGVGAIVILCVILYRRYRKRRERQSDQYQRTMASASERLVYSLQL